MSEAKYNSVFTLAFSLDHKNRDGSDLTADDFREAIRQRMAWLVGFDDDLWNAVQPPEDTYELGVKE